MPRPKRKPPDPVECDSIALSELEAAVKDVLLTPKPEEQHSENRDPTLEELNQKWKLKRRT
ncbi:MAG: hypothetical protein F4142_04240 [Nitrospira sp. SB0675_bin_23]|nr:hypothetical protein [Nitrospira sp. SB0675_bin_23]